MTDYNIEEKLRIKSLKIGMIKKDFIKNNIRKIYDYEQYILEFINCSKFVQDNGNKMFKSISHSEQNNGQADIDNGIYQIELKMLVDSKSIENMAYYSGGIYQDEKTKITMFTSSEYHNKKGNKEDKEYKVYIPIKAFRGKKLEDYIKIENNIISDEADKIIKPIIKNIKKNKNVLFYIPFNIYLEDQETSLENVVEIVKVVGKDLKGFIDYRNSKTDKHTYFCFISGEYIVFIKCNNSDLEFYDLIKLSRSKLYNELQDINTFC